MYQKITQAQTRSTSHLSINKNNHPLTFCEVFNLWRTSTEFTDFYIQAILEVGYPAFYWEHPALRNEYLEKPYEFILQKSQTLGARQIDEKSFSAHISNKSLVEDFMNLGRDARLVVPTKKSGAEIYMHLGSFLRHGSTEQKRAFFKKIGEKIFSEINEREPIWLNTAGGGVAWLHVRMDTRPKYYKTMEYRQIDFLERPPIRPNHTL